MLGALSKYTPRDKKYIKAKNGLLDNVEIFTMGEKKLLKVLKMKYFL